MDPRKNNGRGGGIRTHDPLPPRQVRYQAALRPDICGNSKRARIVPDQLGLPWRESTVGAAEAAMPFLDGEEKKRRVSTAPTTR